MLRFQVINGGTNEKARKLQFQALYIAICKCYSNLVILEAFELSKDKYEHFENW